MDPRAGPAIAAIDLAIARADVPGALAVVDAWDAALAADGVPVDDPRRVRAEVARVDLSIRMLRPEAQTLADALLRRVEGTPALASFLPVVLLDHARLAAQARRYERAEAIAARVGTLPHATPHSTLARLQLLATTAAARGQRARASRLFAEALEVAEGLGERGRLARLLVRIAHHHYQSGDRRGSADRLRRVHALADGDPTLTNVRVNATIGLAHASIEHGDPAGAAGWIAQVPDHPEEYARYRLLLEARLAWVTGRAAEARSAFERVLAGAPPVRFAWPAKDGLSEILVTEGRLDEAVALRRSVIAEQRAVGHPTTSEPPIEAWVASLRLDGPAFDRVWQAEDLDRTLREDESAAALSSMAEAWARAPGPRARRRAVACLRGALAIGLQREYGQLVARAEQILDGWTGRPIPLGGWELEEELGRGAFGVVLRATGEDGGGAAVKVLADPRARSAAFEEEARLLATLDHPAVVRALDFGRVDPLAARLSGGALTEGSPWLALELAEGGTLEPWCGMVSWETLRSITEQLLRALAHAHAHGVIHRDVKPANVLVSGADPARGIRLTDFGLAMAGGPVSSALAGTPLYMAPEQHDGDVEAIGPWTDLFALGATLVHLASGAPPGAGLPLHELRRSAGLLRPTPPTVPVPPGWDGFLAILMARDPADRFRHAADALAALHALGDPSDPESGAFPRDPTTGGATFDPTSHSGAATVGSGAPVTVPYSTAGPASTGLTRARAFVGRARELGVLAAAADRAAIDGRARVVVVRGPSGIGKTALVERFARGRDEVGAARVLRAAVGPGTEGPWFELAAALVGTRDRARLEAGLTAALVAAGTPREGACAQAAAIVWGGPDARSAVVTTTLLCAASTDRPILAVVDDAAGCAPLARLAEQLEGATGRVVLVALVADDEGTAPPAGEVLEVGPLDDGALASLFREWRLAPAAATELGRRAAGHPALLHGLFEEWRARGLLEVRSGEYVVAGAADELPGLPEELGAVWSWRAAAIRDASTPDEIAALELLAVASGPVSREAWVAALASGGWRVAEARIEGWLRDGVLEASPRLRFRVVMLGRAFAAEALASGRAAGLHHAWADTATRDGEPLDRARHLVGAGRWTEALAALERAESTLGLLPLVHRIEQQARGALVPDDDPVFFALARRRVELLAASGDWWEAVALADDLPALAARCGGDAFEAELWGARIRIGATSVRDRLAALAPRATTDAQRGRLLYLAGLDDLLAADRATLAARLAAADPPLAVWRDAIGARAALRDGDGVRAEALARSVLAARIGWERTRRTITDLGDALRLQDRADEAREVYLEALRIGSGRGDDANLGLALLDLRGRGVLETITEQVTWCERRGEVRFVPWLRGAWLAAAAVAPGDAFERAHDRVVQELADRLSSGDGELAHVLLSAARAAREDLRDDRAELLVALAIDLLAPLGRPDLVARAERERPR